MHLLLLMILSGCTSLFYQPDRYLYATPDRFGVKHEDVFFDSRDQTRLHGWYMQHNEGTKLKGLVTFFHGNAQNLSSHFYNLAWLTEKGYDVFIFDYRGYGLSVGKPTPEKVNWDAITALEKSYQYVKEKKIPQWIVHAQSLGGVIAMRALEDFKHNAAIDLLVLDSTFDSYDSIAFDKLSSHWLTFLFSPLGPLLVSDEYAPTKFFKDYQGDVLVMHGNKDFVIPPEYGTKIYERLTTKTKILWEIQEAGHIDAFYSANGEAVKLRYLKELTRNAGAKK